MTAMSSAFAAAAELIDVLCDRGYEPDGDAPEFIRADLSYVGLGTVRVIVDDAEVAVHVFDRYMALRWTTRFTASVPLSAVVSLLDDAEPSAASFGA